MSKTITKAELQRRYEEQLLQRDETIRMLRAQLAEARSREDLAFHAKREPALETANAFGSAFEANWHPWR